jgi:hypothetical protein
MSFDHMHVEKMSLYWRTCQKPSFSARDETDQRILEFGEHSMDGLVYDVIFRGEIADGREVDRVQEALMRLLKINRQTVGRLFSGQAVVIKRQVDYQTANRYREAFEKAGAVCALQAVTLESDAPLIPSREEGGQDAPNPAPDSVACPKCGHLQPPSQECARCGIIFRKLQANVIDHAGSRRETGVVICYDTVREKKQIGLLIFLLVLLGAFVVHARITGEIKHPPGILVACEPKQVIINSPRSWQLGTRVVVPLAHFSLQARVLSKERYRFDSVADLAPVDLALGWGPMSDQRVLDALEIAQGSRRFALAPVTERPPLPIAVLLANSSNMHMIPANGEIRARLEAVRPGALIELSGYLVGVQEAGQWTWVSSLSRTDTGDGACEIVWVKNLTIL